MPTDHLPTRPDTTPEEKKPREGGFALALGVHAGIIALVIGYAYLRPSTKRWGDESPIAGSIQASMVTALPLPPRPKPIEESVLATEKPSIAPTPPPPTPIPPKAKAEPVKPKAEPPPKPKEVLIPTKATPPKPTPKVAERETPEPPRRAPATPPPPTPKATTGETSATAIPQSTTQLKNGTSAITVEERSFGNRYAYYIRLISQKVNEQWLQQQQQVDARSSNGKRATITFTINRDGTPTEARVNTRSGSSSLDAAALRAIQSVDGFGPLPQGDHISVDFSFDFHAQ
ncbi:TonB family protein [Granulicella tundricola]|uniref:TonB family protein n=1 Tax=Granulicella tundricola (strain ATCC BAA-1859 / DSM 23138 / MP5ACTX9) TaxID=1198114 RepID=E8WXM4_GRATM|nr:TonB family protein [Granulicella tundricola]ADW68640.1 TonB family protein [Granulicella tundricola MP5ACTX9]